MSKRYKFKYPMLRISTETGYYSFYAKNNTEAEEHMLEVLKMEEADAQQQLDWYKREYLSSLEEVERVY